MHDVAVTLDRVAFRDFHRTGLGHAAHVVAAQVEQHEMLGALLGVGQQARLVGAVFVRSRPARAGAGDRPDRHFAIANANQDFRAGPRQRKARQVQEVEEGRGVHPPQRAIEREGRQGKRTGEALGQHHLEDVACLDVVLRAQHHVTVLAGSHGWLKGWLRQAGVAHRQGCSLGQAEQRGVDPLFCLFQRVIAAVRPHRRDAPQRVGQPVEDQDQGRADKQHVRQGQRIFRRARQLFDQAIGFIAEIADQAGQDRRQFRRHVNPAFAHQRAQLRHAVPDQRGKGGTIIAPLAVHFRRRAGCPEHQVRIEAQQAVAPPDFAALNRFQQEVAAPFLDQLDRSADRGFGIRHQLAPDQAGTA